MLIFFIEFFVDFILYFVESFKLLGTFINPIELIFACKDRNIFKEGLDYVSFSILRRTSEDKISLSGNKKAWSQMADVD